METQKTCIGKRLKEARLAFGISQKKLGVLAGIDENSASSRMNQYEMGKHTPNFITLKRIGKILGYPVEFFYSDNDVTAKVIYLMGRFSDENKIAVLSSLKNLALKYEKDLDLSLAE